MKRVTLFLLVVLVAALFWLRNRREVEQGHSGRQVIEKPLLPGLETARVNRIRIEHLERGVEVLLERDSYGRWFLSEPIAYPAEGALVQTLLNYLHDAFGPVVLKPDLEALSLAPPRVVVKLEEEREGQEPKLWQVEIGAVDLDVRRVYARVPGHPDQGPSGALVTRVLRSLDTTLDRNPDDYRSRACTTLPYSMITEVARSGDDKSSLDFDVFLDGATWRRRDEPRVSMDPAGIGLVLRATTSLRVKRFMDDAPKDVSSFGLDNPRLQLELRTPDGRSDLLVLSTNASQRDAPIGEARWYAMRDGFPHVWEIRANDVHILVTETSSLFDYAVTRAPEDAVQSLSFKRGTSKGIMLEQVAEEDGAAWWVEELGTESTQRRRRADGTRVGALISKLVQAELGDYAPEGSFEVSREEPLFLVIHATAGDDTEACIGDRWQDPADGSTARLFQRSGEHLAAAAPPELLDLFDLTLEDLEDRLVLDVDEFDLDRISLAGSGGEALYTRQEHQWSKEGVGPIDGAQAVLLERLLHFEALEWLDESSEALVDPIHVSFSGRVELEFVLARLPDQRLVLERDGRRALLAEDPLQGDLHASLGLILSGS